MGSQPLKRILVVEDEKDIADIIALTLNKKGYQAEVAYDGEEALGKLNSARYDLLILDLMLPKMDGRILGKKIQSGQSPSAGIPVIVMTAHAKLKELLESKQEFNVSAYLEKPFPISTLTEKIKEVIGTADLS